MNRMDTKSQYEGIYNKNIHIQMPRAQMIQHKIRGNKLKQFKDETKVSFYGRVLILDLYLKEKINKRNKSEISS